MPAQALIVSHGQPSDPLTGETEIAAFAEAVQSQAGGLEVRGVTLASPGGLEDALARMAPGALLYPLFMADGWFTKVALPKRVGQADVRILPPYGCDPGLAGFGIGWLRDVVLADGIPADARELIVVGHGSGRSPRPADITRAFAAQVQSVLGFGAVRVGFVEEDPRLVDVLGGSAPSALCLPFFASKRGHVLEDLPEAVQQSGFAGTVLDPIGTHPCTAGFIALSLQNALTSARSA